MAEPSAARSRPAQQEFDVLYRAKLKSIQEEIGKLIIGQKLMVETMICALLSKGHVLLEGVPGLAKSLTVSTFARTIGGQFKRVQFTPDKLPSDITGTTVYNEARASFEFHRGPIFCNILLADEINRAAPKVQSALLEAMQEKAVSVDLEQHELPGLFMVLATQNPIEQLGTYPLSEAQIDRFMAKINVEYPKAADEAELLRKKSQNFDQMATSVAQVSDPSEVVLMQQHVLGAVSVSEPVLSYILEICLRTRPETNRSPASVRSHVVVGVSPRGGEHLISFGKAYAYLQGRNHVTFEDVDACAEHVLGHRLVLSDAAVMDGMKGSDIVRGVIRVTAPY